MFRKMISLVLAVILLTGCTPPKQEVEKKQYQASFLTLFDTVTTILGYAQTEEEFEKKKAELLEKKDPNKVNPSECNARRNGYKDADDEAKKSALLCEGAPSYNDLGNPVYNGDEKEEELNQTALFVKPSHYVFLLSGYTHRYYIKFGRPCLHPERIF